MKKLVLSSLLVLFSITFLLAQKYAYVDTEYILDNIPEYKDAQKLIDELADQYQKEIERKFGEIDKLYQNIPG
ncbi:MAG: OmpH family outer membrane protein [Bacteroidales bacterium]